jgi:hypothetical protein
MQMCLVNLIVWFFGEKNIFLVMSMLKAQA